MSLNQRKNRKPAWSANPWTAPVNARAPLPALLTSIANAGWGDLGGREFQGLRTTLHALAASLPYYSAQGLTTVPQIAQRAGLSTRWVSRCLHLLEDLGLIVWRRGGIANGEPVPSFMRVMKTALLDLIDAARPLREAADLARRQITARRIAGVKWAQQQRRERLPRSDHAELNANLPTPTGEVSTSPPVKHGRVAPQAAQAPLSCPHCATEHSVAVACPGSGKAPGGSLRELLRNIHEGELT